MTTTVAENLVAAYGRLLPPDRAWLEGHGVPPLAIHMYPGPIGITPKPSPMFIHPVYAEAAYSDIVGAVAWPQRDPSQFVMAAGAAIGLGQHFLTDAADRRGSLAVVSSPLEWLTRYGACFCPLVWPDAAVELSHLSRIVAMPSDFGPVLRRQLDAARPRLPRIEVAA